MEKVDFSKTHITEGFWKQKQDMVRNVTAMSIYNRFEETGRIEAFKFDWKEGMPNKPHIFWDSDIAKWIEGVAYITEEKREPKLEALADSIIDDIEKNQEADGYFNIYFIVVEPEKRFTYRDQHELYCAGHLMEAAVAYYRATGKDKLLKVMCRYADYIEKRFVTDNDTSFHTPGHEEIELALVRLYECTGEKRYLDLSKHFIDLRGGDEEKNLSDWERNYNQSDKPARELSVATGHSVRAVYYYSGMADIAYYYKDKALADACERLFRNITEKRMYITGGIGSSSNGEAFTLDYDLPNILAYSETCAALGLALFAHRMLLIKNDCKYADIVEKVIYNGFLSGVSLKGDSFFYENPLEIIPRIRERDFVRSQQSIHFPITQRKKVFDCSCCPPNVLRFISSIANFMYTVSAENDTVYVHQFAESESSFSIGGKKVSLSQKTDYPKSGKVEVTYRGEEKIRLAVRIPGWSSAYEGKVSDDGYIYCEISDGETVSFDFGMPTVFMEANPNVEIDCGRYAVMRGPVVYCLESVDNGASLRDIILDGNANFSEEWDDELGVLSLKIAAKRRKPFDEGELYRKAQLAYTRFEAKLIPYYAFANRGESEMTVWMYKS